MGAVRVWAVCKAVRFDASIVRMSLDGKDIQEVQTNIRMKSEIKLQKKTNSILTCGIVGWCVYCVRMFLRGVR